MREKVGEKVEKEEPFVLLEQKDESEGKNIYMKVESN